MSVAADMHDPKDSFVRARRLMVASQLRPSGVNDPRVVAAMATVPREVFVPTDRVGSAYSDRPVPLGAGREMAAPVVTGRLLTELQLRPGDRALLIGAGMGYAAALLTHLVAEVVAVEEDDVLFAAARDALAGTGVRLIHGPLADGHAAGAPYDAILIDGAVDRIPDALIEQMADGGRLAAGLIDGGVGRLVVGRRGGAGFGVRAFEDAEPGRLPGFSKPPAFVF